MNDIQITQKTKDVIDKTILYILKNPNDFETRLKDKKYKKKFDFLDVNNEFHSYYKQKLEEQKKLNRINEEVSKEKDKKEDKIINSKQINDERFNFFVKPLFITKLDLEVIKLTALFVSKNGYKYIQQFLNREQDQITEGQFDFVNKDHSLNKLFQTYIKQYKLMFLIYEKGLESKDDFIMQLKNKLNQNDHLNKIFEKSQKIFVVKEKKKVDHEKKAANVLHYASIDWNDFSIVELVNFDEIDDVRHLPPPLKKEQLIYRSLSSKKNQILEYDNFLTSQESILFIDKPDSTNKNRELDDNESSLKMKKMKFNNPLNFSVTKAHKTSKNNVEFLKCPLTNEMIPQHQFDKHIKILLQDPKSKKEKEKTLKQKVPYSNSSVDSSHESTKRQTKKRTISSTNILEK